MTTAWLVAGPALVAGCARIEAPPADVATRHVGAPQAFAGEQRADSAVASEPVPAGWIDDFNDPALSALVREAWERNPDLYVAAARFEEAAANLRVATSLLYPSAGAFGSASHVDRGSTEDSIYAIGLQASWEIDLWGRLRAGRLSSREVAESVGLDWLQARHSLAAAVAQSYFALVAAEDQLGIDRELLQAEQFTATTTRQRVAAGLGTSLDENLAESNVMLAEAAVRSDLAAIESARRALEILVGRYPAANAEASQTVLPDLPGGVVHVGLPSQLLERRPDVRSAEKQVNAAYYGVKQAKAARLPSLTLTGSVASAIDPDDILSEITANLFAPLFTGGRLQSEQVAANARQRQALGQYASIALQAFTEVEDALANERYLAERSEQLAGATERLREASRQAEGRYQEGLLPILDLQQIRRQDFQTRSQYVAVRFEQLRQRIGLHLALGGPVFPENTDQTEARRADALLDDAFVKPGRAAFGGELRVGTETIQDTDNETESDEGGTDDN